MSNERMCAVCGVKPAASQMGRATRCLGCRSTSKIVICDRCLESPAEPGRGLRRCTGCRLLCARCDQPKVEHSAYCQAHRLEAGKARPRLLKTCLDCGKEFKSKAA